VPILRALLAREARDPGKRVVDERAVDDIGAVGRDPGFEGGQRLRGFGVRARRERVGIFRESAQPQRAIDRSVGGNEAPDLRELVRPVR
jgi:hypothetical protein